MAMVRLAQVFAGILVATVGIGSLGVALGRPGPRAAGKPADQPAAKVPESWIGKKVVLKYQSPLRDGDRVVSDGEEFYIYTVEWAAGDRVKVVAEGLGWFARASHEAATSR
jgi:hypothetical protein